MMRASGSSTADETSPAPGPGGAGFGGFFGGNGFGGQAMPSASPTPAPDPNSAGTGGFFGAGMGSTDNPAPSTSSAPSMMCTPLAVGASSGNIGTEARCFTVTGTIAGWQVSSLAPRTLTVNGANVSAPALPAAVNGAYTFAFSAGEPEYTQFNTW
jgi:hypothetical protein